MNFYIVKAKGTTLFKVGVAKNTFERIRNLQTGSPYRIRLEYSLQSDRSFEIEQLILNDFKKFRLENEWLMLPDYALKMLYSRIKEILACESATLRVSRALVEYKHIFSFSGIERACGIPSGTLHKLNPPYRNLPFKHVPELQKILDQIFRSLI